MEEKISMEAYRQEISENIKDALPFVYEMREHSFASAADLRAWIGQLAGQAGVSKPVQDDERFSWFCERLWERFHGELSNPWETACFIEFHADIAGHFFADGSERMARLLSAYALMRKGLRLPEYRERKEYDESVGCLPYAHSDPMAYQAFWRYYQTLIPREYPKDKSIAYSDCGAEGQVIYLAGEMDAANAKSVQAQINELRGLHPEKPLSLNLVGLKYISSMGLRVFLTLAKRMKSIAFVDVSPEAYEIFEMTGLTQMMPTEKMMRRLSVDGCTKLSEGANGEIYRMDGDTMVKAYRENFTLKEIRTELEAAKAVFMLGIPTAISYDIVRLGNRFGAVYEMLEAETLAALIHDRPDRIEEYARMMVQLLKSIHEVSADGAGSHAIGEPCRDGMLRRLRRIGEYLPADCAEKLKAMLEAVPDDDHLVHGDCHAKNIMVDSNGELYLIDMDSMGLGQPIFEFSALYATYVGYRRFDDTGFKRHKMVTGMSPELTDRLWELLLKFYFEDRADHLQEIERSAKLLSYVRLMNHYVKKKDEGKAAQCKATLIETVAQAGQIVWA